MSSMFLFLLSCKQIQTGPVDDTGAPTSTDAWPDVYALSGSLTWSLEGAESCSFVATYAAVEDWSQPWTCPDCEVQFVADVTVDDAECYQRVHGHAPLREYLGLDSEGALLHQALANFPLLPIGHAFLAGDSLPIDATLPSVNESSISVRGTLDRSPTDADPWHGFAPPGTYACGWPKADPPAYEGPWEFHVNQTIPDGWFLDTCGEPVRLHDLAGRYLVIDVAAVDCAPCQQMANGAHAFETALAKEGIEVTGVTLLAPSVAAILDDTPIATLEAWTKDHGVTGPVLADRGWGYAILERFLGAKNYPTWAVVSPDLRSLSIGSGFESYDAIEEAIRSDLD
jgi:hypothetical protein